MNYGWMDGWMDGGTIKSRIGTGISGKEEVPEEYDDKTRTFE